MSLRRKTLLIIGITVVGLFGILIVFSQNILLRGFSQLENVDIQENTARIINAIQNDIDNLSSTNTDWAFWDDSVDFVEGNYPAYIDDNLDPSTLAYLGINIMSYSNSNGELVYALSADIESGEELPLPEGFLDLINNKPELLMHPDQESSFDGIVSIPEGLLLLVSRPIISSDQESLPHGALIMARYMDDTYLQALEERTHLSIAFHKIDDSQMPPDFANAISLITVDNPIYSQPLDTETIAGYILQNDILSEPTLIIRADKPREIYRQGQISVYYFLASMVLAGVGFILISVILLERNILSRLTVMSRSISDLRERDDITARVPVKGNDELTNVSNEINRMLESLEENEQRLQNNQKLLEQNNLELARRARDFQIITEITRDTTTVLDLQDLLKRSVQLIKQQFDFYHVAIFLKETDEKSSFLWTGFSEGGLSIVDQEQDLNNEMAGIIGDVVKYGKPQISLDITIDDEFQANPKLPLTKSEAALPLLVRDEIIGVLDIQDTSSDAFSDNNITVLQTLADQLAIAIYNTYLFQQANENLDAVNRAYGELSSEAWKQFLGSQPDTLFISTPHRDLQVETQDWSPDMTETYMVGQITKPDNQTIHIPVILRDKTLGIVRLRKREESGSWSNEEIELMNTLVDQLETALETARLYSDTQRQAARVSLTQDVTDKLHRSLDMDTLMQTLLQEISSALGAENAFIQLSTATPETGSIASQVKSPK